jgi:hypothetical protein
MKAHFQKLYGEISMYAMDMIIEEQCLPVAPAAETELLKRIYECNDMDERHLMCAEYLGYEDAAKALREWIAKKAKKRANR